MSRPFVMPDPAAENGAERHDNEYRLWQLLQSERDSPAGAALWLTQQMGLQLTEIIALTWEDVDLDAGTLRTRGQIMTIPRGVHRVLRETFARRGPGDDPHVLLSPGLRRPLSISRISLLVRQALTRGGLDGLSAGDVRMGLLRDTDWRVVRALAEQYGAVGPGKAAEALGLTERTAARRLQRLEREGRLVHVGRKYYLAENTPPAMEIEDTIRDFIRENGSIGCAEASDLLGIPPRQIAFLLSGMLRAGELIKKKRGRYQLPDS